MFHYCPQYSSHPLSLLSSGKKKNQMATRGLPFPCKHSLRRAGCQSHRGSGTTESMQTEQPSYLRVSYCSFSCPLAQIPSLSTASKKLFRHMFVFGKTHTQFQDSPTKGTNCRYWGTSPLRSYSNIAREKKTLDRRITKR